jgi:uncharacterized membrane protein YiaA
MYILSYLVELSHFYVGCWPSQLYYSVFQYFFAVIVTLSVRYSIDFSTS